MDKKTEIKSEVKEEFRKARRSVHRTGIAFGILLILLGGLLVGSHAGFLPANFNRIVLSWQMLVIVIGILSLFKRSSFFGLFLILVGGFFIIPRLAEVYPVAFPWVNETFISGYWAGLLIGAGVLIVIYWIVKPRRKWSKCCDENVMFRHHHHRNRTNKQYEINRDFSKSHVFSSGEYIVLEPEFNGGEVNVVFGATELDLRKTSLPEGDTYLEINVVFSGIVLRIPDNWRVESQIESVFSGVADKRRIFEPVNSTRRLILVGSCVFSGCEIKD
jgi:predicted membrane protein